MEGINQFTSQNGLPSNSLIRSSKEETLQCCENVLRLLSNCLIGMAQKECSEEDRAMGLVIQSVTGAIEYVRRCQ